jgi:hypothetical protein
MSGEILVEFFMSKIINITGLGLKIILFKFCQELKAIAPIIAFLLFLINMSLSKDSFTVAKEKILLNERDFVSQKFLINLFELNNQFSLAEIQSATTLTVVDSPQTKKLFEDLLKKSKTLEGQETLVSEEINNWGRLINSFPSYRDGYIKLAILSWKTNRLFETKKYLEKALTLDPNFEVANIILQEAT